MQIARMATTPLRPVTYNTDIEAFRHHCGGQFTGTYNCPLMLGTPLVYDAATGELVSVEGVLVEGHEHLNAELAILRDAIAQDAAAHGKAPEGFEGLMLRVQGGLSRFQLIDIRHPDIALWRQVNLLADLFCHLETSLPHVRPVQHQPTSALRSEGQFKRWLGTWKKPGIGGVLIKRAEYLPGSAGAAQDVCLVRF